MQTEQIRRINRLWASDSLFLREHLLIPVGVDSPASTCNDESAASDEHDISPNVSRVYKKLHSKKYLVTISTCLQISSPSSISLSIDDESSVNDFLAKMDTSIANVKREVKRAQGNSE